MRQFEQLPATDHLDRRYNVGATDECSTVTLVCNAVTTTNGCDRTRVLTWTATDACSNSATCSQTITWTVDPNGPTFTKCPVNRFLSCNPVSIPGCDLSATNIAATDTCSSQPGIL